MKSYVLIIMKPDALERELVGKILKRFLKNMFQIEIMDYRLVDEALIVRHYRDVIKKLGLSFEKIMKKDYVGKPMIPIILSQEGYKAIENGRRLTGETDPLKAESGTIRGDLGLDSFEKANLENRSCQNLIHCCDSKESLMRETGIWFDEKMIKYLKLDKFSD